MSDAGLTPQAAEGAHGYSDRELNAGFISKQTPLETRAGEADRLPQGAIGGGSPREAAHPIQPESDGPDVMMEPLRQHDPEERLRSIADAQADTDIACAKAHATAVKNHGHN